MLNGIKANLIWVSNLEVAREFYEQKLGFRCVEYAPDSGFLKMALGESIFYLETPRPEHENSPHVKIGVRSSGVIDVDDIQATVAALALSNVTIVQEARQEFWGGWTAIIADPDGNQHILVES